MLSNQEERESVLYSALESVVLFSYNVAVRVSVIKILTTFLPIVNEFRVMPNFSSYLPH